MTRQDQSFGVVPLRHQNGRWEVFLIQHCHGRYWGFPKGHAELNETPEEAACRELKEETNLDIVRYLQKEPLLEQYQFMSNSSKHTNKLEKQRVFKRVFYFVAEVSGEVILQENEISNGLWLPIKQAFEQLTHPEGRAILAQVEKILAEI